MKWPINSIKISADRQRKSFSEGDIAELRRSLNSRGLINPITVHSDGTLIAGERRLRAAKELNWTEIDVHIFEGLSQEEQREIELEENVRRVDLTWQEEASAYLALHRALRKKYPGWTQAQSEERLGVTEYQLATRLQVGVYLEKDPTKIAHCSSLDSAANVIARLRERAIERETTKASGATAATLETIFAPSEETPETTVADEIHRIKSTEPAETVRQADFLVFAKSYNGAPFNFIHCDFPYGINYQNSDQGGARNWAAYEDTPEIFWSLTQALLDNRDRLVAPSAHIMFWYSMAYHTALMNMFSDYADLVVNPVPLIWMKSDGSGILPDPKRGPRRIYETALIITRGDRYIVKPISNAKDAPIGRKVHLSEKPQPVLRHFFQMFLDETSTVFDPSCGSGNALAVAEEFKVRSVLGLDLDEGAVELARATIRKGRVYQKMGELNAAS